MTNFQGEIDFVKLAQDVACIKQAVMGNGVKGLCERVSDLEDCQKSSNKTIGILGGIGVVFGSAITFLIQIFKG